MNGKGVGRWDMLLRMPSLCLEGDSVIQAAELHRLRGDD